jgi:hypothetical protein
VTDFTKPQRREKETKNVGHTCRVKALVCLVTKKLVKFTKYASEELKSRYQTILESCLARATVISKTLSSINSVAGSKKTTAIGAMYSSKFIEFSFSLKKKKKRIISNSQSSLFGKKKNEYQA